ncbi:T-cell surface glycoprotein CD1a-like [Hyaena hyaena]|uniref:T-cell surface glycoprotein CD1a-like n=1 Tax=Hyaena hyaena TaxID=95912 RepID=UPI001920E281|nr:T-cell surface glycoprotein CD1a-like [Hyaena hyaena]
MLFLLLVLLTVLVPGGDSDDDFQELSSFRIILTISFYNHSWTQNQASAWLDELQTHTWDSKKGIFMNKQPWSKGNFSNKELTEQERALQVASIRIPLIFQDHVSQWQLKYPFQVQMAKGCELRFGEKSVGFKRIAYQGSDLMSFQNTSWIPSPKGGERAQQVCKLFNQYHEVNLRIQALIKDLCSRFLWELLDAGKADLQRQVRPEAWLSSGPSPGPGRLLLVCHVSGFHPKPVRVMWMRGEQEQPGTRRGDVLPQADGTWYLQVSLEVEAREAAGLSCRVRHSSLGGQDVVLYWEQHRPVGWAFLAVMVPLVLLAGLAFWLWKCRKSPWRPQCTGLPLERNPSSPGPGHS